MLEAPYVGFLFRCYSNPCVAVTGLPQRVISGAGEEANAGIGNLLDRSLSPPHFPHSASESQAAIVSTTTGRLSQCRRAPSALLMAL